MYFNKVNQNIKKEIREHFTCDFIFNEYLDINYYFNLYSK